MLPSYHPMRSATVPGAVTQLSVPAEWRSALTLSLTLTLTLPTDH
jgi:hypothetical protein